MATTTTSTITAQSVVPSTTAGIDSSATIYANTDALRFGFVEGAVVTLSAPTFSESATISSIVPGTITFTTSVSAIGATIIKDYTGPHKTQAEAQRKHLLGLR